MHQHGCQLPLKEKRSAEAHGLKSKMEKQRNETPPPRGDASCEAAAAPRTTGTTPTHAAMESLDHLTPKHGVRISPSGPCSVEDVCLAVGDVVGDLDVKSASWMDGAIVVFVATVAKAEELVARGIVVSGTHVPVLPF